jgi:hypothetical protein
MPVLQESCAIIGWIAGQIGADAENPEGLKSIAIDEPT